MLSAGPPAALARACALQAGGVLGLGPAPDVVVVPFGRTPATVRDARYVRSRHLGAVDLVSASGLPRTTIARALVDEASRSSRDRTRTRRTTTA